MQSLKELIERHSPEESDFRYYIPIIEKAEDNEIGHPDICIECCTSLFQGVSKSIVYRLDLKCDRDAFEKLSIQQQVKQALRLLKQNDDVVEDAFPVAAENLARVAGTLRNTRGDISHGRATPKELHSDRSLARFVLNVSEAVLRYMLASYFAIKPELEPVIEYDANSDFNAWLDGEYPLEGKPLYSLALYQQFYEDYRIQLAAFLDERELEGNEE
ncbi:abortive infection family protein [Agrobacterium leguminum]|uniref:abortive infection family protein n=1 Tax=Agrobacterium leguminum TaxID=2792015 RepID=UPI0030D1ECEB